MRRRLTGLSPLCVPESAENTVLNTLIKMFLYDCFYLRHYYLYTFFVLIFFFFYIVYIKLNNEHAFKSGYNIALDS